MPLSVRRTTAAQQPEVKRQFWPSCGQRAALLTTNACLRLAVSTVGRHATSSPANSSRSTVAAGHVAPCRLTAGSSVQGQDLVEGRQADLDLDLGGGSLGVRHLLRRVPAPAGLQKPALERVPPHHAPLLLGWRRCGRLQVLQSRSQPLDL